LELAFGQHMAQCVEYVGPVLFHNEDCLSKMGGKYHRNETKIGTMPDSLSPQRWAGANTYHA
ncbi:MAG: hypothetical protein IJC28_06170, partial [Mailhella sp.]|nr:hypothetical protein [Mailhella sp.]